MKKYPPPPAPHPPALAVTQPPPPVQTCICEPLPSRPARHTWGRTRGQRQTKCRRAPVPTSPNEECIGGIFLPAPGFCPSYCRRKPVLGMCPQIDWQPGLASPRPERTWWSWVWPANCRTGSSPPSAPRPVGAGSGRSPCPASTRPSPGEGSPGRGKARKGAGTEGGRTPTRGPTRGAPGLADSVSPNPTWLWGPSTVWTQSHASDREGARPKQDLLLRQDRKFCSNWKQSKARRLLAKEAWPEVQEAPAPRPAPLPLLLAPHLRGPARFSAVQSSSQLLRRSTLVPSPSASVAFSLLFSFPTPYVSTFAGHKSSFSKLAGTIWGIRNRPRTRPLRSEANQGPARAHAQAPRSVVLRLTALQQPSAARDAAMPWELSCAPRGLPLCVCSLIAAPFAFYSFPQWVFFFSLRPQFNSDKEWKRIYHPPRSRPPLRFSLRLPRLILPRPLPLPFHRTAVEEMGFTPRGTGGVLIILTTSHSRGWKNLCKQTDGKCGSGEGRAATSLRDRQHPSPTHLQSLTPGGALGKPYRRLKEVSIWALMVCVCSSWVLACASQWMCETGTVLVRQGVPNRSKWDFGKKSTGEGGKILLFSLWEAFRTFWSPPLHPPVPLPTTEAAFVYVSEELGAMGVPWVPSELWTSQLYRASLLSQATPPFAKRKSQTGMNGAARESWRFCFLPLSLWELHAKPFLRDPRLPGSGSLLWERGSEKGWSARVCGAWGRQWQPLGKATKPCRRQEMRAVPGNLWDWRCSAAVESQGFQSNPSA